MECPWTKEDYPEAIYRATERIYQLEEELLSFKRLLHDMKSGVDVTHTAAFDKAMNCDAQDEFCSGAF